MSNTSSCSKVKFNNKCCSKTTTEVINANKDINIVNFPTSGKSGNIHVVQFNDGLVFYVKDTFGEWVESVNYASGETTESIQLKRPLKTIENQSLEGVGNIDLEKGDVGLSNVDNTSDLDKPISNATQTALDNKVEGTGVDTRVAFWTGANTLSNSINLLWNYVNSVLTIKGIPISSNAAHQLYAGVDAGLNATNASYSNFFGINAGKNATNANRSNFFGLSAGIEATNASYSNFFGQNAGFTATNANRSNFFGLSAGSGASEAIRSNFFGTNAGTGAANASYSNFFGDNTGSPLIGSNNILIGRSVTLPDGTNNGMNIGSVLFGTGFWNSGIKNSTGSAGGRIGILTNSPEYTLDINGDTRISNTTGTATMGLGRDANGKIVDLGFMPVNSASIPAYANIAAAEADVALTSGSFFKVTNGGSSSQVHIKD